MRTEIAETRLIQLYVTGTLYYCGRDLEDGLRSLDHAAPLRIRLRRRVLLHH